MFKFFRKFRQRLLADNKLNKYLIYAIGEIVLVVIGILIALQINRWNESLKIKSYEIGILEEIKANLISSKIEVSEAIEDDKRWRACIIKILDYLDNRKEYDPELDSCFGSYYWSSTVQFSSSAYQELKGRGIEIISNKKLRREITHTYDLRFDVLESEIEVWDAQLLSSSIYPLHVELFRKYFPENWNMFDDEYAKPINYEKLQDNDKFKNLLAELISLRNYSITVNELLEKDLQLLIEDIETELIELKE